MIASVERRLFELRREQWRRICRAGLVAFAVEVLAPRGEKPACHHIRICRDLESVVRGATRRKMILAPPGSAKTTYVSRVFRAFVGLLSERSDVAVEAGRRSHPDCDTLSRR
jgi:hypothetical protein